MRYAICCRSVRFFTSSSKRVHTPPSSSSLSCCRRVGVRRPPREARRGGFALGVRGALGALGSLGALTCFFAAGAPRRGFLPEPGVLAPVLRFSPFLAAAALARFEVESISRWRTAFAFLEADPVDLSLAACLRARSACLDAAAALQGTGEGKAWEGSARLVQDGSFSQCCEETEMRVRARVVHER